MSKQSKILIVEDEANLRMLIRAVLETGDYELLEASDGLAGLRAVEERQPNIVLLDLAMPVMDGMTMLEQLSIRHPKPLPPVIVLSAHGNVSAAVRAMRLGAVDVLEKPLIPENLRLTVAAALEQSLLQSTSDDKRADGQELKFNRIIHALRRQDLQRAERLLTEAEYCFRGDGVFLNLIGVYHELNGDKHLAKRFYRKSMNVSADRMAPETNLRRIADPKNRCGHLDIEYGDVGRGRRSSHDATVSS